MYNLPIELTLITYVFIFIATFLLAWILIILLKIRPKKSNKISSKRLYMKLNDLPTDFVEDESYRQALRILDEARMKSLKIVADSKVFDEKAKEDVRDKLDQIFQSQMVSLQEVSQQMLQKYTELITSEVEAFKTSLHEGTLDTKKKVAQQVKEEYEKIKKEIDEYKAKRIEEMDQAIYKVLTQVMTDIFGKVLSLREHEELIIKILDDAKKEAEFEMS